MEFHEAANIFPMMTGQEYTALRDDIRATGGPLEPIILYDGKILDGRNRYTACLDLKIEPRYQEYKGTQSPLEFVISKNLHRRHLNETQRGVVASKIETMKHGGDRQDANLHLDITRNEAATMLNVSPRTVASVKAIERAAPDLLPKMESGQMSAHEATKEMRQREIKQERAEIAASVSVMGFDERWNVYHSDVKTWQAGKQYDFIVTDPPYPKEYLPLYETLAIRAHEWLKPGGLLVAMCGQSYLDEIYAMMSRHLVYYWTACYLLPGQPTPLRTRQVNTTWKPILIYSTNSKYTGKIFGDVYKSDGNDKDFHKWGQSVSGMYSLISQICVPGQSILDPFCGAGTTGIAALRHGCTFDGVDIDIENVNISKGRLHDSTAQG